jgi:hypothetical protein
MLRTSRGCSFSRASEAPRRLVEADDAIPDASPRSIGQPLGPGCGILAGRNYRNDIAHGFLGQMDPVIATLLLRAGALFLIMPLENATAAEMAELKSRPVPLAPRQDLLVRLRRGISAGVRAFRQP